MGALTPCSETNDQNQIDFGGPMFDGQGREKYFPARIDGPSKFPTLKHVNNRKDPKIEKNLTKYISQHGVHRKISLD